MADVIMALEVVLPVWLFAIVIVHLDDRNPKLDL